MSTTTSTTSTKGASVPIPGGRAPVMSRLPAPSRGHRWVGPVPPLTWERDEEELCENDPWYLGSRKGDEHAGLFQPILRDGEVATVTSGRLCARTRAGWWVEVPSSRPSLLALQVGEADSRAQEEGPYYRGPLRDVRSPVPSGGWGEPAWVGEGMRVTAPSPRNVVVGVCGGRLSRPQVDALRAWGVKVSQIWEVIDLLK